MLLCDELYNKPVIALHNLALTDINDLGKVELPEQRSRAQPETVRGQPAFPEVIKVVVNRKCTE